MAVSKEDAQNKVNTVKTARGGIPVLLGGVLSTTAATVAVDEFVRVAEAALAAIQGNDSCADLDDGGELTKESIICRLERDYDMTNLESFDFGELQQMYNMVETLENDYGITVRGNFTLAQLQSILDAVEMIGTEFSDLLVECLEECEKRTLEAEEEFDVNIEELRLQAEDAFQAAFGPVQIEIDENESRSKVDMTNPENPIIRFAPRTLSNTNQLDEFVIFGIVHEFSHIIVDRLGEGIFPDARMITIEPLDSDRNPASISIWVQGGPTGQPDIVESYLQATNGYFSGFSSDFGFWYRPGGYTANDDDVHQVTNINLAWPRGTSCENCENVTEWLVDQNGNCIPNDQDNCIQPYSDESWNKAKYARDFSVYYPVFDSLTEDEINRYFPNETSDLSVPSPKEGVADLFAIAIVFGIDVLPENESRRQFFEANRCCWIFQQFADVLPGNISGACAVCSEEE